MSSHLYRGLLGLSLMYIRRGSLHLGGNPRSEISGAPSLGAHLRGISLDCGAKEAARVVLDEAQAQVGKGDEPAETFGSATKFSMV